ncbi:hypothetical protein GCM10009555_090710 [Acrocarpospora macrocephala]|uniref:CHAT domain-containing protein n=1 Tax=Acrocarpospora macrocephala TaxID=150177 RepID=A0A5M3WIQ6_9ACTN|nr:CHAT domain-containing protein [Acrocarpospora macrocephala]GES09047.1 hypothetical protein Amac_026430 [Acrocarpospora macrocephala]
MDPEWFAAVAALVGESAGDLSLEELAVRLGDLVRADEGNLEARRLLGWLHWYRYQAGGDDRERYAAVEMLIRCFVAGDDELPTPLLPEVAERAYLAAMNWRAQALDDPGRDISYSIQLYQRILRVTPDDLEWRAMWLSELGVALRTRFQRTGVLADLNAAIEAGREALHASLAEDRGEYLNDLANAFQSRFERIGDIADLNSAIQLLTEATNILDDIELPIYLNNLGNALLARFGRSGGGEDLDDAIRHLDQALALAQAAPPELPADLNEIMRALLESTAGNEPDLRAAMLFNLGNVLLARSSRPGAEADLDTAIDRLTEAAQVSAADHEDRAAILAGLGNALLIRFGRTDLAAAVDKLRQAVDATPADHPERAARLINLGRALESQPEHRRDSVFSVYAEAVRTASAAPSVRIEAARSAARIGPRAAELMETAVHLLPEVAPRQLDREDQQYALGGFAGLAADAAALTLADTRNPERASRALHLLEQGRTILLSQAMDTRSDLSDLRESHPDLAARFAELRDLLDRTPATAITISSNVPPGATTRDRHALAAEFSALIARIRRLNGFAGFMSPPSTEEILAEAAYGPVVVVNVSTYRSDALIVTTGGVVAHELPDLTLEILVPQINTFHEALRDKDQERQLQVLAWLWEVVAGPVLSVLGLGRDSRVWPRLWWAPGGLLGLLPLHAAGRQGDSVLDRVVSSYTPTVRGLRYAREQARRSAGTRALIVAMPTTPGKSGRLWQVPAEREMLRRRLPGAVVLSEPHPGPARPWRKDESDKLPTKANVLDELPTCSIAHFACHGTSDATNPSRSKLLLHDHASDPFTVASLGPVRLRSPRLAYLSACETALTSNTELVDEAIHLASAFQLAGYPHVIGTLWKVNDRAAFDIADTFYATLTEGGTPSHALHHAVRAAREYAPGDPSLWAAHVHSGA